MTKRLLALVSGMMLLAACEAPPTDDGLGDGTGTGGQYGNGYDGGVGVGSQADLEKNVGDRVFFSYDSSVLSSEAQATLQRQAQWLQSHPSVNIVIEGHCDERGTRAYNLALGERRGSSAKNYLASLGISPSRMTVVSYGKERPAVIGSHEGAWAQNRRAVTVISY